MGKSPLTLKGLEKCKHVSHQFLLRIKVQKHQLNSDTSSPTGTRTKKSNTFARGNNNHQQETPLILQLSCRAAGKANLQGTVEAAEGKLNPQASPSWASHSRVSTHDSLLSLPLHGGLVLPGLL